MSDKSLAQRILDYVETKTRYRSDPIVHEYGGPGYADGVHRKDCGWCALLATEYSQRNPLILPDTFVERVIQAAQHVFEPNADSMVILSAFEAAAIRQKLKETK